MNGNINKTILNRYEKRQKLAHDNLEVKRTEIYEKIPEIRQIDDQIQLSGLRYNKKILNGDTAGIEADQSLSAIETLKKVKEDLLIKKGYPANYLTISYQCPRCNDTGFFEGKSNAEKCPCYIQQYLDLIYVQSNLKLLEKENFSTFEEKFYPDKLDENKYGMGISPRKNILAIKERCLKFIENFDSPGEKNLFFSGPAGTGKTFMCNCIAAGLLKRGVPVLYQTAPALFSIINEYKMKAFREESFDDSVYKNISDINLLIIDDLATESPTAARYAELLTILDTRQANNLSMPCKTVISTNINAKELYEYYDERIASRIIGGFDMYKFAGEDIRRLKKFPGSV